MSNKEPEPTKEEDDESLERAVRWIRKLGMEVPAILLLQTFKPLAFIMGELAAFSLAPFLILIGDEGFKTIDWLEKTKNIEKLIQRLVETPEEKKKAKQRSKDEQDNSSLAG